MRIVGLRFLRILTVAIVAYFAVALSKTLEMPWLGYCATALLFGGYGGMVFLEAKKRSQLTRESRWEQAIYDGSRRSTVIGEVTKALAKIPQHRLKSRSKYANLSVLLAELHDAEGDYAAAQSVIDTVPLTGLTKLEEGLVRHTRAVIHLRAGAVDKAELALAGREPTGDLELDQRLELLDVYVQLERGAPAAALPRAEAMALREDADEGVQTEARVVRAAALDALGRREEALVVLAALGRESLEPLTKLGQPRVRALAQRILEGVSD